MENEKRTNTPPRGKKQNHTDTIILFPEEQEGFKEHLTIKNRSKATKETYQAGAKQFIEWITRKGINDLREVSKEMIRDYQQYLKKEKTYTLNTESVKQRSVKRFFDYLEESRQILYNPSVVIKDIKLGQRLPTNILSKEEVRLIMSQPNTSKLLGIRDRMIMELLYSTGIRLEELRQLTVYDIDYKTGFIRVNKGKFAKDRVLPIGKTSCRYLQQYINRIRPELTKDRREERSLLVGQRGKQLKGVSIGAIIKKYARKAGISKKVSTHTWRHTFASHMLSEGADVLQVQRLLGHSQPEVTMKYTKVTPIEVKNTQNKAHPREKDQERVIKAKKEMPCQGKYQQAKKNKS